MVQRWRSAFLSFARELLSFPRSQQQIIYFLFFLISLPLLFNFSLAYTSNIPIDFLNRSFDLTIIVAASLLAIPALFSGFFSASIGELFEILLSNLYTLLNYEISPSKKNQSEIQAINLKTYERSRNRYCSYLSAKNILPIGIAIVWMLSIYLFTFSAGIIAVGDFNLGFWAFTLFLVLAIFLYFLYDFFFKTITASLPDLTHFPLSEDFTSPFNSREVINNPTFLKNNTLLLVSQTDDATRKYIDTFLFSPLGLSDFHISWVVSDADQNIIKQKKRSRYTKNTDKVNVFLVSLLLFTFEITESTKFPLEITTHIAPLDLPPNGDLVVYYTLSFSIDKESLPPRHTSTNFVATNWTTTWCIVTENTP